MGIFGRREWLGVNEQSPGSEQCEKSEVGSGLPKLSQVDSGRGKSLLYT